MVMDELNKNDENDKLCIENILSLNRTLVEQSTTVFGSQNELSSLKKLVSSNKKAADQSATLLRDQMILHNDMLRGLSGINRTEMERSIEDQTKIIDQIGEIMRLVWILKLTCHRNLWLFSTFLIKKILLKYRNHFWSHFQRCWGK